VLNRFPYNNGHLLIAPIRHIADLTEATDEEIAGPDATRAGHSEDSYRWRSRPMASTWGSTSDAVQGPGSRATSTSTVVPRWNGDTNFVKRVQRHQGRQPGPCRDVGSSSKRRRRPWEARSRDRYESAAGYAVTEAHSRGRDFPEDPHPYRSAFERDRDRIIHSSAFRRLEARPRSSPQGWTTSTVPD